LNSYYFQKKKKRKKKKKEKLDLHHIMFLDEVRELALRIHFGMCLFFFFFFFLGEMLMIMILGNFNKKVFKVGWVFFLKKKKKKKKIN